MKIQRWIMAPLAVLAGVLWWQSAMNAAVQAPGRFGANRLAALRERMQETAKELNLTEAQKGSLKAALQPQMQKAREIWQDESLSREQKVEKLKAMRTEFEPKAKEILTAEQWEHWQQKKTQAREGLEAKVKAWNITDEQKAKLKGILQPQMGKLRALRQDTLSPKEKMDQLKAMRDEVEPKLKEVLTAEQYEKWEKVRTERVAQLRERWKQGGRQ